MRTNRRFLACCFLFILGSGTCVAGAEDSGPGRHALWRGFDQLHFTVDGRACYVVVPRDPARGKPWIWQQSRRTWLFSQMIVKEGTQESHGHHFPHPNIGRVIHFITQHAIFEGGSVASGGGRTLNEIDKIYASMPPLEYRPPADRGEFLPGTIQRLREGGTLRVVMLGDSIINDTSRSQWQLLLEHAVPKCDIMKWTAVRGSTGCWWYRENDRVGLYVLQQKPDLVVIGGISQRDDVAAIGEVIRQIRAGSDAEILLTSGAFGRVDPRDDMQWQEDIDPHGTGYRARLKRLAGKTHTEFLDMRAAWGRYIRGSDKDVEWFKRDVVHANERGEQIIGRILARYLTPPSSAAGENASASDSPILKVATCQFPVSGDVAENAKYIKDFIRKAAANKADVVHFSEAALSGYAGADVPDFDNYDWDKLRFHTQEIVSLAKEHSIWVVLGSAHYLSPEVKPTNCLYIISRAGEIVDRYDKSMCTGGDLRAYTPGNHLVTIDLKGVRCGFLICYDSCFPEMYNVYRHQGVEVMFHSFYNARHEGKTILDEIIPAEIRVRASDNLMWVVANNSSADHSAWPTCIARPDGSLTALKRGVPGILYRTFPDRKTTEEFSSWTHNNKAMILPAGEVYHNGTPSQHPRATNRRALP